MWVALRVWWYCCDSMFVTAWLLTGTVLLWLCVYRVYEWGCLCLWGVLQWCCDRVFGCSWSWVFVCVLCVLLGFACWLRCYECCCDRVFETACFLDPVLGCVFLIVTTWLDDYVCVCAVFLDCEESKSGAVKGCFWLCAPDSVLGYARMRLCVCSVCDWILLKIRWCDNVALTWWLWLWLCDWKCDWVTLCCHLCVL